MRVVFVNHISRVSGAEMTLRDLIAALPPEVEATVACPGPADAPLVAMVQEAGAKWAEIAQWRPHARPPWRAMWDMVRAIPASRALGRVLRNVGPDLVHCNSLPAMLLTEAARTRAPAVWHARDLRAPARAVRIAARRAAMVIAISRAVEQFVAEMAPGASGRIRVVYNGLELGRLTPRCCRDEVWAKLCLGRGEALVGYVAQLVPWKRVDVFLRAARLIADRCPARFVVCGADLFEEHKGYGFALRRLVKRLRLEEKVRFVGWREDVTDLVASMDVYLHAADTEPLGRAILEAMALGTPCVAARAAGPAEIIEDGRTGLLFEPGSAEDAARAVVELLEDRQRAQQIARAAREEIEKRFTAERMAREMVELYKQVLEAADDCSV